MPRRRVIRRDERGESLVEMLVAIVILGVAAVAIVAGVELGVRSSDLGRRYANGGTYVRGLAEAIQHVVTQGGYVTCGGSAGPSGSPYLTHALITSVDVPSTYVVSGSTKAWNGAVWVDCTSATDRGVQQLTLTVSSGDGGAHQATEKLAIVLRKPSSCPVDRPC